jgi:F-type H+-transporting ATPase subunit b
MSGNVFRTLLRSAALSAALCLPLAGLGAGAAFPAVAAGQDHGGDHEAGAGGHDAHHFDALEFAASIVNFLILVGILVYLARKPTRAFLVGRKKAVQEALEEATRLKAEAEAKYAEYKKRLDGLDAEIAAIRADIIKSGEAERDRIIAEAERKAARIRKDAEFLIEQQVKQLRLELRRDAVEAALAEAEKILREKTSADDQQRLARDYVAKLAETARNGGLS